MHVKEYVSHRKPSINANYDYCSLEVLPMEGMS